MKTIVLVLVVVHIVRSAIVCDTEYKCKEKVALNRMKVSGYDLSQIGDDEGIY